MKFKVGDRVRLVGDNNLVYGKSEYYGKIFTIARVDKTSYYPYKMTGLEYIWRDSELELVTPTIVITADGVKITTANLYEDGKCVKTAEAKCAPEDTFDFMLGAKLACERLTTPKPNYYNGKVVCVKSGYDWWTVGKVYEVKDGIITANDGDIYPKSGREPYRDVEDVRHAGCSTYEDGRHNQKNEFIPLVED